MSQSYHLAGVWKPGFYRARERGNEELKSQRGRSSGEVKGKGGRSNGDYGEGIFSFEKHLQKWPAFGMGVLISSLCCSYSQVGRFRLSL